METVPYGPGTTAGFLEAGAVVSSLAPSQTCPELDETATSSTFAVPATCPEIILFDLRFAPVMI